MTPHVNHKAEALRTVSAGWLLETQDAHTRASFLVAEAQVHATLELARQQQIANLIALANDGFAASIQQQAANALMDPDRESACLNPTIAVDLGVTE